MFKKTQNILSNQKGFTLVELMIVVAIIGILAGIAIPNFRTYQAKSRQSEAKLNLTSMYTLLETAKSEYQSYSSCLSGLGYSLPAGAKTNYTIGFTDATAAGGSTCGLDGAQDCTTYNWSPTVVAGTACAGTGAGNTHFAANSAASPGGPTTQADLAATAITKDTYRIGAEGKVGGAVNDEWTIDNNKDLRNTVLGVN